MTTPQTVSLTRMSDGTAKDYEILDTIETQDMLLLDTVLDWLHHVDDATTGYKVTRLEHPLQAATRADRAGEDEEYVVCVLLHYVGDVLAPADLCET